MKETRINMMGEDWYNYINDLLDNEKVKKLSSDLGEKYKVGNVLPEASNIFRAFKECRLKDLKVVIIGQDPYPNKHANGIAFSTFEDHNTPSLEKIFEGMHDDLEWGNFLDEKASRDLLYLCKQGVLLLNSRLTVEKGKPKSHCDMGWEELISKIIGRLANDKVNLCFLALGNDALEIIKSSASGFNPGVKDRHLFIKAEHPAAASYNQREWKHNNCFSEINNYLAKEVGDPVGDSIINW